MPPIPQTEQGFAPFEQPVQIPGVAWDAAPQVCIGINIVWATYLMGAALALTKRSTWNTSDQTEIDSTILNAWELIGAIASFEACPMPVQFRTNPDDPHYWDYSNDGGATWTRQPDTVSHFTPVFTSDMLAPSGYDLSVNGGLSDAQIPLMTASDPTVVITDPSSLLRNEITAGLGIDGLAIQALGQLGVVLQRNGISAFFQKVPGLGLAADAVTVIAGGGDYTYDLLKLLLP